MITKHSIRISKRNMRSHSHKPNTHTCIQESFGWTVNSEWQRFFSQTNAIGQKKLNAIVTKLRTSSNHCTYQWAKVGSKSVTTRIIYNTHVSNLKNKFAIRIRRPGVVVIIIGSSSSSMSNKNDRVATVFEWSEFQMIPSCIVKCFENKTTNECWQIWTMGQPESWWQRELMNMTKNKNKNKKEMLVRQKKRNCKLCAHSASIVYHSIDF